MSQPQILTEEYLIEEKGIKKENGSWFISGIFGTSDTRNRNGRIYPAPILESAVKKYDEDYIKKNRAIAELGHPTGRVHTDPDLAAIKIISLVQEGKNFVGKAKVLNTDKGKNLQALLEDEVTLGISSRALGSLRESNGVKVIQDLEIHGYDVVFNPSNYTSIMNAIMEETIYCPNENCYMLAEEIKHQIKKASSKNLEATVLSAWNRYCNQLNLR